MDTQRILETLELVEFRIEEVLKEDIPECQDAIKALYDIQSIIRGGKP